MSLKKRYTFSTTKPFVQKKIVEELCSFDYENIEFNESNSNKIQIPKFKEQQINWSFKKYKDVYLIVKPGIDGIVLDANFQIIEEQFRFVRPVIFREFYKTIKQTVDKQNYTEIDSAEVFFDPAWKNYFHFLVLTLPKYCCLNSISMGGENTFLLPSPANFKDSKVKSNISNKKLENIRAQLDFVLPN